MLHINVAMIVLMKEMEVLCTAFFCGIPLILGDRMTWQHTPISTPIQGHFLPVECQEDKRE